jgi:hypothetical protein
MDPDMPLGIMDIQSKEAEQRSKEEPEIVLRAPEPVVGIQDLKARLHARIEALRSKRKPTEDTPKSRQEIIERRQSNASSKPIKNKKSKVESLVDHVPTPIVKEHTPTQGDQIQFGKIKYGEEQPKNKKGNMDAASALKHIESKQAKLQSLKESNPEKAAFIEEKERWNKIMTLATGEKVKDDAKLLRKTVKRKEKQKEQSSKKWKEREDSVKKSQEDRQRKRRENLEARKQGTLKKGSKSKKRPGFEGGRSKKK